MIVGLGVGVGLVCVLGAKGGVLLFILFVLWGTLGRRQGFCCFCCCYICLGRLPACVCGIQLGRSNDPCIASSLRWLTEVRNSNRRISSPRASSEAGQLVGRLGRVPCRALPCSRQSRRYRNGILASRGTASVSGTAYLRRPSCFVPTFSRSWGSSLPPRRLQRRPLSSRARCYWTRACSASTSAEDPQTNTPSTRR